jgi:phosphate transport system protein
MSPEKATIVERAVVAVSDEVTLEVDRRVIHLFARVSDAIAGATDALLSGDRERAKTLVRGDAEIDSLYRQIDTLVLDHLRVAAGQPEIVEYCVSVLRLLPELERSGDLAAHIARRATRGVAAETSPRARGLIERMGEVATSMWAMAADAYGDRSPSIALRLDEFDDEMDELHLTLIAELASGEMALPIVIELTLVARFYERLGDHAVNVTRRVPPRPRPGPR